MVTKPMYTLRTAREINGLTQKEAAHRIGISVDSLSNYERGKNYPTVPTIRKIESLYGISYDQIIFLPIDYGLTVKN